MARSAAHGPPALARVKAAMRGIAPAPGDARSDLLVVVASRLVMNSGQPVSASDVVDAAKVAPADAWVRRAFGADAVVAASDVEAALRQAKEHFFKNRDGRWGMKGWPFARKLECAVGDDWAPGGGAPAAFAREKKPAPPPTAPPPTADRVGTAVATTNRPPGKKRAAAEAASAAWLPKESHPSASPKKAAKRARTTDDDEESARGGDAEARPRPPQEGRVEERVGSPEATFLFEETTALTRSAFASAFAASAAAFFERRVRRRRSRGGRVPPPDVLRRLRGSNETERRADGRDRRVPVRGLRVLPPRVGGRGAVHRPDRFGV
jgi:hypothetical protein